MEPEKGVENPGMGTNEGFKPRVLPGLWTYTLEESLFPMFSPSVCHPLEGTRLSLTEYPFWYCSLLSGFQVLS